MATSHSTTGIARAPGVLLTTQVPKGATWTVSDWEKGSITTRLPITDERVIHHLLLAQPELLRPDRQGNGHLPVAVLGREIGQSSGSCDILALDGEGEVYLVETKLFWNQDARKVVAQALDYAAALWSTFRANPNAIQERLFNGRWKKDAPTLEAYVAQRFGLSGDRVRELIEDALDRISTGNVTLVIAMDCLTTEVTQAIEFLGLHEGPRVVGLELQTFQRDGTVLVSPQTLGTHRSSSVSGAWTSDEFEEFVRKQKNPPNIDEALRALVYSLEQLGATSRWGKRGHPAYTPCFPDVNKKGILTCRASGDLTLQLRWFDKPHFDAYREALLVALRDGGIVNVLEHQQRNRYPVLANQWVDKVDVLVAAIQRAVRIHREATTGVAVVK